MLRTINAIIIAGSCALSAIAIADEKSPITYSRGFQQAKILAKAANDGNIPSRGLWLGTRLVKGLKNISLNKESGKKSKVN